MNANEYRADAESFSLPDSAADAVDGTEQEPDVVRVMNNRILRTWSSSSRGIAAAVAGHQPFPFRTLIVCFTIWLIATQAMIFDQVKFDARTQLIEQAARSLGGPRVVVPTERPSNLSSSARLQRL
jgi:hypothetical protein